MAAVFGGIVGLAVGFAYLGGAVAQSATIRGQATRIAGAYDSGFTEEALAAAVGGLDQSALTVARRHDPYATAGAAQRDRQTALLTAILERRRGDSRPAQAADAGLRGQIGLDVAQPFRMNGAREASRDLECLTQAVYYEARGEGQSGMQAVAQVILNRVRHGAFPRTICGVVFQGAGRSTGCQFSFTCNGSMRARIERGAWERARSVAARALDGFVYAPVGNATHFHTTAVNPRWSGSLVRVGQVGSHIFYRFGGRRGGSGQFRYTPQPSQASVQAVQDEVLEAETVETSVAETEAEAAPVIETAPIVTAAVAIQPAA